MTTVVVTLGLLDANNRLVSTHDYKIPRGTRLTRNDSLVSNHFNLLSLSLLFHNTQHRTPDQENETTFSIAPLTKKTKQHSASHP